MARPTLGQRIAMATSDVAALIMKWNGEGVLRIRELDSGLAAVISSLITGSILITIEAIGAARAARTPQQLITMLTKAPTGLLGALLTRPRSR